MPREFPILTSFALTAHPHSQRGYIVATSPALVMVSAALAKTAGQECDWVPGVAPVGGRGGADGS